VSLVDVQATVELRDFAAVVGVGETDYGSDYRAARSKVTDYVAPTDLDLATTAFERALADSGLTPDQVDGMVSVFPGNAPSNEELAEALAIKPRFQATAGAAVLPIPHAVGALARYECDTLVLLFASSWRASGRTFGGNTFRGDQRDSYYYYHPWGFSSPAAHWAFIARAYMAQYGSTEDDLAAVSILLRNHAMLTPNATMQDPLTLEEYRASRYIVEPLHLYDMCLVNDGAVCIVLQRTSDNHSPRHTPVLISGWGKSVVTERKMHYMVQDRLSTQMQAAGKQLFDMAGVSQRNVQHFQGYDASSIHLISQLEGYGFVEPGGGLEFCKAGEMGLQGSLPVNTSGGLLSQAYMLGWNHLAEAVHQLRHEAGRRQVPDVEVSMQSFCTTESAHPFIFKRGT
jgi:acetyl-CoA acetyltransferase